MKKYKIWIGVVLFLMVLIMPITASAETLEETTSVVSEFNSEYYVKLVTTYVVSISGTLTGAFVIVKKILSTLKGVKDGTKSIDEAKKELERSKSELLEVKKALEEATKDFVDKATSEETINQFCRDVEALKESFKLIACNSPSMVGDGLAKQVKELLTDEKDKKTKETTHTT